MTPAWIREQDASPVVESLRKTTSSTGRSRDKIGKSRGRGVAKSLQTGIENHFRSLQNGSGGSGSNKPTAESSEVINGKRKKSIDPGHKSAKKRRGQSGTPDASLSNTEEGDDTVTAFDHSFIAQSLFGAPPKASLTPQARTPRKSRRANSILLHSAPAISPSKRKTLLTDTQRDVAMQQQHRRSPRSSSPLCSIGNKVHTVANGGRMTRSNSTSLTPSKLRHGYSLLAFDEEDENHLISSECIDETEQLNGLCDPSEQENSPSPSAERRERADSAFRLAYIRSPKSNKRIYAQETLQTPQSPLDKFNEMRERELKEICERFESGKKSNNAEEHSSQDTLLLSSPPPSSPGAYDQIIREADALLSSQTAPGGSFSIQREEISADAVAVGMAEDEETVMLETYMSEEEPIEEDIRRGCGDETFRLLSSQDVETPFRVHDVTRALRSGTKSKEKQRERDLSFMEEANTQLLAWSPSKEAAERQNRSNGSNRGQVEGSWNALGRVWGDIQLSNGQGQSQASKAQQTSLQSFGFSRRRSNEGVKARGAKTSGHDESKVAMSNDVVFASDEEIESDIEERNEINSEETQELAWSDEIEEESREPPQLQRREKAENAIEEDQGSQGQSQLMMMMLPDEDDLNTQGRDWLDRL